MYVCTYTYVGHLFYRASAGEALSRSIYSQLTRGKDGGILVVIMQTFDGVGFFCKYT